MLRLVVQVFDSWQCHFVALGTITPCLLRPLFLCQGFTHGLPTKGMPRIEQTAAVYRAFNNQSAVAAIMRQMAVSHCPIGAPKHQ